MAVRLTSIEAKKGNRAEITAFADSKEDVVEGMTIIDLPYGVEPVMGSSIITADGELAFLKSDGSWNWVGDDE